jgi:amino-acid N-acetyltransferase
MVLHPPNVSILITSTMNYYSCCRIPWEADIDRFKKYTPSLKASPSPVQPPKPPQHEWVIPKIPPSAIQVTEPSEASLPKTLQSFVSMFRAMAPYIAIHRDKTMILHVPGEVIQDNSALKNLINDIGLFHSIGIRIVIVAGCSPQIDGRLTSKGVPIAYDDNGLRVTDDATLSACKDAAGDVRLTLESLLERGLASAPDSVLATYNRPNITSGNFLTAAPLGTINGVDYCWTGRVRRIHVERIAQLLDNGDIVVLGNLGFSPFGELYNCSSIEVAAQCAIQLQASKLIFLHGGEQLIDKRRGDAYPISNLSLSDAKAFIKENGHKCNPTLRTYMKQAVFACEKGVKRTHLVSRHQNGGVLSELFTRDGAGLIISRDLYEGIRTASVGDIHKILKLIQPFVDDKTILPRTAADIEASITDWVIVEREGTLVACSALIAYENKMAELACVAVSSEVRKAGTGDAMLGFQLRKAMNLGIEKVFALSTVTMDWFKERGFVPGEKKDLPPTKLESYNEKRKSKIMIKSLTDRRVIDEQELLLNI